jgi:hypothetical protein
VRDIEQSGGAVTYFFDQVEALAAQLVSDEQAILLTGYRRGGEHGISVGSRQVSFPTYCAKAFASIGAIAPDLRSRSIVARLAYGVPTRDWSDAVMVRQGEAEGLLAAAVKAFGTELPKWEAPDFLGGREREIWTPLWSIAMASDLDAGMVKRIRRAIGDSVECKRTMVERSYRDLVVGVQKDERNELAVRALRDLAGVLPERSDKATGDIFSESAVGALRDLDGPWRVFGGEGLSVDTLASLLARFDLRPVLLRQVRGRAGQLRRGYRAREVRAAVAKLVEGGQS